MLFKLMLCRVCLYRHTDSQVSPPPPRLLMLRVPLRISKLIFSLRTFLVPRNFSKCPSTQPSITLYPLGCRREIKESPFFKLKCLGKNCFENQNEM